MLEMTVDPEKLIAFADRIELLLSAGSLEVRVLKLAEEAGIALHAASVRACIESIYDQPESLTYERTFALLESITLYPQDGGFVQRVTINPDAVVEDAHSGRELVTDYAIPVHEGYTQWIFGTSSGDFHPGKFWFHVAAQEAGPVIVSFIEKAFYQIVQAIVHECAA